MVNVNETLLGVNIGEESITWGRYLYKSLGRYLYGERGDCLPFHEYGFHKRQNERFVLPYAVGCQPPTLNHNYELILQGINDNRNIRV